MFEILHRYRFFHTKKKLSLSINGELELRNLMKSLKTLDYCIVLIIGSGWFSMVLNSIAWYCLPTHIFSKFLEGPIDKVFIHCCQGKLYPAYASSKLLEFIRSNRMPIYIDFFDWQWHCHWLMLIDVYWCWLTLIYADCYWCWFCDP